MSKRETEGKKVTLACLALVGIVAWFLPFFGGTVWSLGLDGFKGFWGLLCDVMLKLFKLDDMPFKILDRHTFTLFHLPIILVFTLILVWFVLIMAGFLSNDKKIYMVRKVIGLASLCTYLLVMLSSWVVLVSYSEKAWYRVYPGIGAWLELIALTSIIAIDFGVSWNDVFVRIKQSIIGFCVMGICLISLLCLPMLKISSLGVSGLSGSIFESWNKVGRYQQVDDILLLLLFLYLIVSIYYVIFGGSGFLSFKLILILTGSYIGISQVGSMISEFYNMNGLYYSELKEIIGSVKLGVGSWIFIITLLAECILDIRIKKNA